MVESEWEKKRKVLYDYNSTASHYDSRYFKEQHAKYDVILRKYSLYDKKWLLDLACGTGLFIKKISKKASHIVGIDLSLAMLKRAKLRCKSLKNVNLICCDADYLPFKKASFDSIFSFTLLQNLPEPRKMLKEMRRVAKPHAFVVVTSMKKKFSNTKIFRMISDSNMKIVESIRMSSLEDHIFLCTIN